MNFINKQQTKVMKQTNQMKDFLDLAVSLGVIKKQNQECSKFVPIKIAFYPFQSSSDFYYELQKLQKIWQKLISKASRNRQFVLQVFKQILEIDPLIKQIVKIFLNQSHKNDSFEDYLLFVRCDFFLDKAKQPKLIEYNLTSISMSSHSENIQRAKKLHDFENSTLYPQNNPTSDLASNIALFYEKKKCKGLFVFIIAKSQVNIVEQRIIELKIRQKGIEVLRITMVDAYKQMSLNCKNDLLLNQKLVSMVYFRTGYQLKDYKDQSENCWKVRQRIALSNAYQIPTITMELMNQKRMQVQLSKPEIYNQHLEPEEALLLSKSLIKTWQFDHMNKEEFGNLLTLIQKSPKKYILKPNLEGGGNNIYNEQVLSKLLLFSPQQRKKYILMEKIETDTYENILINNKQLLKVQCIYEFSAYGFIAVQNSNIILNTSNGFLIRAKPEYQNEGGVMAGIGSLCTWKFKAQ